MERTLLIIKPDAVAKNAMGEILGRLEGEGFVIRELRMTSLSQERARAFYEVHRDRPFYGELVEFMTSGPVVVQALEGENAVAAYREVMGATNPAEAADGTIRKLFAKSIGENTVHGSDSEENAAIEIAQFFSEADIAG